MSHRAPEILLGAETYSTPIDIWSVGCIFGELLLHEPVFQAKGELEMIAMVRLLSACILGYLNSIAF